MIRRFFIAFAVGFVCVFGATAAFACTSDEFEVDGTCVESEFQVTTTWLDADTTFSVFLSAKGMFYIDWGDGTVDTITRTNTTNTQYSHTYTNAGEYTVQFNGNATGYYSSDPNNVGGLGVAATRAVAAISFYDGSRNGNSKLVAGISGSLGKVFPTIGTGSTNANQPRFANAFAHTLITDIPNDLFSGISGVPAPHMFYGTFGGTNISYIPVDLFSGVSGAAKFAAFGYTFSQCSDLTSVPDGLFRTVSGNVGTYVFVGTFSSCSGLTRLPNTLFGNAIKASEHLFSFMFAYCNSLSGYVPSRLFDSVSGTGDQFMSSIFSSNSLATVCSGNTVQYITGFESYWNGKVSCVEPFVIPIALDDQSATIGASPTTVYLKYGTDWYVDADATTPISTLATNPTKTDYNFDGYWTVANGAGTQVIDENGVFITSDSAIKITKITDAQKTIYANWTQDYTVTYDCGDGIGTPPENGTATLTKTFTPATNTCTRDGYIFSGWGVSGTTDVKISNFVWNYTEDKTFTAQWAEEKFSITTTSISTNGTFRFYMSAKGTFYVDCGDGGTLSSSASDVSGMTVTRSNTTGATYTCTYSTAGIKTIRFGGIAGTAANKPYSTATTAAASAIRFNVTPTLVASVSGSLGAIFPTRNTTYTPRFRETFSGCTNLTEIPSTLFSGVTGSMTYQFYRTFYGCTSLQSIPDGLFSGISGAKIYLFYQTFYNCSGLTGSIPSGLFSNISGTANYLFYQTFYNCSGLTGYIPAGMFDKITTYSTSMMASMFYGTGLDTTCSGTTVQYITGFEGYWSSKVSCTEPFVTPVVLDDQSATTGAVPTTVYLKYRTGWYSDSNATTPISALTTNPTKTDYNFDGYWTVANGAGTQVIDENGVFITSDSAIKITKITDAQKTIYANWTQDYTVTYDCGDGIGTPPENGTATLTKTFTPATNTCTRDGYIFSGWGVSGTTDVKISNFVWNYTEDKTFAAQWAEPKFFVTTTNLSANTTFQLILAVAATVYIDWGDGSSQIIVRTSTADTIYSHKYVSAGAYEISFAATRPTSYGYYDHAPIRFCCGTGNAVYNSSGLTPKLIAGISGSLGALFPALGGTANAKNPSFYRTFRGCSNLETPLPSNLFAGVTLAQRMMFAETFNGCSKLPGPIPENLFATISGTPSEVIFYETFNNCTNLTGEIPENLFSTISGAPEKGAFELTFAGTGLSGEIPEGLFSNITGTADELFMGTFHGCPNLTGPIPENLFATIRGAPKTRLFESLFDGSTGLTGAIPENLFSGITGAPATYMFRRTFAGATGLSGVIPENLFAGITGAPANYAFQETFNGATNLTGYVPNNLFAGITSGTATDFMSNIFADSGVWTACPCGTHQYVTGFEDYWSGRVSCQVGKKDNEHWNNGVCTTDCALGFSKLKSSTGLEFPILTDATGEHNINIGVGNSVCRVPLANGAANNNINVSFDGTTYHATAPDEIMPTGFTGQPASVEPD